MTFRSFFFSTCILGGLTGAFFLNGPLVNALGLNVRLHEGVWRELDGTYFATVAVKKDREFCLCPAYVCESSMEAALLAYPTAWGWRRFQWFRAPAFSTSEISAQRWSEKPVHALGRQEYCLNKKAGDTLYITLSESGGAFLLNIN